MIKVDLKGVEDQLAAVVFLSEIVKPGTEVTGKQMVAMARWLSRNTEFFTFEESLGIIGRVYGHKNGVVN